jgi:glutamine---fructose-6-phosphate transaminase (isomerizing)
LSEIVSICNFAAPCAAAEAALFRIAVLEREFEFNMNPRSDLGSHTATEIRSQPHGWAESLRLLEKDAEIERTIHEFSSSRRWLFIGCGSSYYLALAAAASWKAATGLHAQAVPASELLLFPDLVLDQDSPPRPILISRSGATSEILRAGGFLTAKRIPFVAVTCAAAGELKAMAATTIRPAAANEESTVMTLSFTSMLVATQYLAAKFAGNAQFLGSLFNMPDSSMKFVENASAAVKSFVETHDFADYVWLGQGPCYGLACEGALKVNEMSCSYAQSYHTLEFRHGPKSIAGPETLIMFQLSKAGFEAERGVLEEVNDLRGTTLVVAREADKRVREAADLLLELPLEGDEYAGLAPRMIPAQLLGLYTGLKKGLDPDNPRNLSRVVTLSE